MRIEGYLFVNYEGQSRFSVEIFAHNIGEILDSKRQYDYLWDATMRQRPTLQELNERVDAKAGYTPFIMAVLKKLKYILEANPKARLKEEFEKGYLELICVG